MRIRTKDKKRPILNGHGLERFLAFRQQSEMATRLESAIARVIAEGKVRTYDMGGKASTLDVAKAVGNYAS